MATNLEGNSIGKEGLREIVGCECLNKIKYLNLGIIAYLGRSKILSAKQEFATL